MNTYLLSILIFSPLLGVLVLLFTPSHDEKSIKWIGILGTLLPLGTALVTLSAFQMSGEGLQLAEKFQWVSYEVFQSKGDVSYPIFYEVGVNGLSMVLILLTSVVSVLAAIASFSIKKDWKSYFILFFLLEIGMLGVFAAQNLFLFFIFFEITLIPMFFLIGRWGYLEKEKAAYSFLIYNGVGSAILLIAFVTMFMKTGTMNFEQLAYTFSLPQSELNQLNITKNFKMGMLIALLVAFAVKLPVAPLHSWMVRVHVQAPPPIVMIHSGILLKIGAYGLIVFGAGLFPDQFKSLAFVIGLFGVINLLYGAFLAITQRDVKRVLAYSSVSHMGIVLIGLASVNEAGMTGAVFQVVSHGLISALLFFLVGVLYERAGSSNLKDFGGVAKKMPIFAGVMLAGGLASLGLPGMSGFISEFMAFLGLFEKMPVLAAIGTLGLILTAVYVLRAVLAITFGAEKELPNARDLSSTERIPAFILLAAILFIGIYPAWLSDMLRPTLDVILLGLGG
ncbi:NADH:ubiquinone oxidoreductase subunit M [Fictibacillus phosphorivorans]|uniref:NADH:ubiquinone oxidoreductase subunit M n=1 Tax=Fictibacillus phosphorivorans TaxID=1221500 RepID=A0A161RRJ2_9BACL|nr:NADH-quinone oxidoreductase subunit M [Fictibacillus phosphorivorans]KZE63939.1 NADH:ubiquinone oxidoreductase subunit M [Fictibacillus phosphorivorans]